MDSIGEAILIDDAESKELAAIRLLDWVVEIELIDRGCQWQVKGVKDGRSIVAYGPMLLEVLQKLRRTI